MSALINAVNASGGGVSGGEDSAKSTLKKFSFLAVPGPVFLPLSIGMKVYGEYQKARHEPGSIEYQRAETISLGVAGPAVIAGEKVGAKVGQYVKYGQVVIMAGGVLAALFVASAAYKNFKG